MLKKNLPYLFFHFSPILKYIVYGNSMLPTYKNGNVLVAIKCWFIKTQKHDVVIVRHPRTGRLLLKRIAEIKEGKYFLLGDNPVESTDSRQFGWVDRKDILGRVISSPFRRRDSKNLIE